MTDELTRRLADESWEMRQRMNELVKLHVSEDEALAVVTHNDPGRFAMLDAWRDKGLWPLSEDELLMRCTGPEELAEIRDLLPGGEETPVAQKAEDPDEEIPSGWMEQILSAVRVTLNAAIMDYHNYYGTAIEERLSDLEQRTARLERSGQPELRMNEIRGIVRQMAQELVAKALPAPQSARTLELERPPEPKVQFGSREVAEERGRLAVTCDKALLDLFDRDRKMRGYDAGEMMDFILYNFYDRPALSFQMNESDRSEQT